MINSTMTALITGASSGIGRDVARVFLERGANVVLNARNMSKLEAAARELGHEEHVALVPGDIAVRETGEKLVNTAIERFGSADVLVNNAGIFGLKRFLDNTEEDVDNFIRINLKGTYFVSQAVVKQMKKQGSGSIVNIGTVLINHPSASFPASAALITKGGVHALTTSLASELAADNIRVNAVAPGFIRTPLFGDADLSPFADVALLNRVGEVRETTEAIVHLATASFTTGVILPVDGGYVHGRA